MKQYWLFFGMIYYPQGGMLDFVFSSDDIDEVEKKLSDLVQEHICYYFYQIYNQKTGEIIRSARIYSSEDSDQNEYVENKPLKK